MITFWKEKSIYILSLCFIESDAKDDMIIACAVAVSADYIVSRDLLDLGNHEQIQIARPEDFVHILRDERKHNENKTS